MQASTGTHKIHREVAIDARPETVWDFLVDSELARRWMGVTASLDAQPGGEYLVEVVPGKVAAGEFVEVDPPRRLVWTWGWESGVEGGVASGSTTIEVELVPENEGTLLRFAHSGLPDAETAQAHARGWGHYLERLATAARGDDPGPDGNV
jgi:uncharacterized protein YndB with AHSA1/START domain